MTFIRYLIPRLATVAVSLLCLPQCTEPESDECSTGIVCPVGSACSGDGTICIYSDCGDGEVQEGEVCDDGNLTDGMAVRLIVCQKRVVEMVSRTKASERSAMTAILSQVMVARLIVARWRFAGIK